MSVKKVSIVVYRCTCDLPDCIGIDPKTGKPKSWYSKNGKIPKRCSWCKRHTWNGKDRRKTEVAAKSK